MLFFKTCHVLVNLPIVIFFLFPNQDLIHLLQFFGTHIKLSNKSQLLTASFSRITGISWHINAPLITCNTSIDLWEKSPKSYHISCVTPPANSTTYFVSTGSLILLSYVLMWPGKITPNFPSFPFFSWLIASFHLINIKLMYLNSWPLHCEESGSQYSLSLSHTTSRLNT